MLYGQKIKEICEKLDIDREKLPSRLTSEILKEICVKAGVDVNALPDGLYETYFKAICDKLEIAVNDRLYSSYLMAIDKAIDAGKFDGGVLPDGYTVLEYIESTGTQYIDTGLFCSYNGKVDVSCEFTKLNRYNQIIGKYCNIKGGQDFSLYINQNNRLSYSLNSGYASTSLTVELNQKYNFVFSKDAIYANDVLLITPTSKNYEDSNEQMTLFWAGFNEDRKLVGRIYQAKIYDNGILQRDFIPCINDKGEVGMYDIIGSKFYGNMGTGQFLDPSDAASIASEPMMVSEPMFDEINYE